MSDEVQTPTLEDEQPIVIHGPITGGDGEVLDVPPDPLDGVRVVEGVDIIADPVPTVTVVDLPAPTAQPAPASAPRVTTAVTERAGALDAFRGFLLLAMNWAFTIPAWGPFPGWMYHTQEPKWAKGEYVQLVGLTWRDMTYPGFLFTMAAALPIVMGARIAKGMSYPNVIWIALRRAFMLCVFALIIGHVNPYWTRDMTKRGDVVAIIGLAVSFAFFLRPPNSWSATTVKWFRRASWLAVAVVLFVLPAWYGQSFSVERQDGIIWSIAFSTVAGTVIWLATRDNIPARLGILAGVIAFRTLAPHVDWMDAAWGWTPAEWLYDSWYLELLVVVIPGTIAGDLVARFMRRKRDEATADQWSTAHLLGIAAVALTPIVCALVGLYARRAPTAASFGIVACSGALLLLVRHPRTERDRLIAKFCMWAAVWLILGAVLEPVEGGIKKDPETLGYLTLMAGAAYAGFTAMLILVDALNLGKRYLRPLVEIGQNPLFAYVVFFLGIEHVLWLAEHGESFTANWQQATIRGFVLTGVVGYVVWLSTRKRLLWRA